MSRILRRARSTYQAIISILGVPGSRLSPAGCLHGFQHARIEVAPFLNGTTGGRLAGMIRLHSHRKPVNGLGISIDFDTSSIVNSIVGAITPALQSAMPGLVDAAWPEVEAKIPEAVATVMPQIIDQVPTMVQNAMPQIAAQVPALVDAALPSLYAQLPAIQQKVMPVVQSTLDSLVDGYARKYMGPSYLLKDYAPAITVIAASLTLFASGIIIYRFWSGD